MDATINVVLCGTCHAPVLIEHIQKPGAKPQPCPICGERLDRIARRVRVPEDASGE